MEKQPSFEPGTDPAKGRQRGVLGIVKRSGLVLGFSLVASALYALVVGPRDLIGFSNGLFLIGAIWLMVGLMPVFVKLFGRTTVSLRMEDGSFEGVLDEEGDHRQQGETTTLLFGINGVIIIVLSLIISFSMT